jgi:hypothetical protein
MKLIHYLNKYRNIFKNRKWNLDLLWSVCACFFVEGNWEDKGKSVRRWLINACAWLRTNNNKDLYPGLQNIELIRIIWSKMNNKPFTICPCF